jgi:pyridoxine/pyridoxamine 5'-phosphate oxidase
VLLKAFDERGFVFYTNYEGRKGRELLAHPKAALCFYWPPIHIQVRIEGEVSQVSDEEADTYFATRDRGSQIGAWASRQSRPLESPTALDERVARYERARCAASQVLVGFSRVSGKNRVLEGQAKSSTREALVYERRRWLAHRDSLSLNRTVPLPVHSA